MQNERFELILEERIEKIKSTLFKKGKEYGREDRLHNFKVAARRLGCTPEHALVGMKEKHCVSVMDIIQDLDQGKIPTLAYLDEKIGDEINYLLLLEALIRERLDHEHPCA